MQYVWILCWWTPFTLSGILYPFIVSQIWGNVFWWKLKILSKANLFDKGWFTEWYMRFYQYQLERIILRGGASGKEPSCQCRRRKRCRFDTWVGMIPWRRKWQINILAGESQTEEPGRLPYTGYQGVRYDLVTEHTHAHTHTHTHTLSMYNTQRKRPRERNKRARLEGCAC